MPHLILNFLLGAGVAAYGTMVGAGGGFLLVPLFLLLHQLPHHTAVGTSLAIVAANALSGTVGYLRDRKIDFRAGLVFAVCTLPGAVAGAFSTEWVSGSTFQKVFGAALLVVALYLLVRGARGERRSHQPGPTQRFWVRRETYAYHEPAGCGLSAVVGLISSWLGIGGGIIHVPLLTEVLRFPVKTAVATSHFILAFTALVGALTHALRGHVDYAVAAPAAVGAILGAQGGVWLSRRVKAVWVLRALALALLLVGVRLLTGASSS